MIFFFEKKKNLILFLCRRITGAAEREVRVTMKNEDGAGWGGIIFGFVDTDNHYRLIARTSDDCLALQRRSNGGSYVTLAQRTPQQVQLPNAGEFFEMRVIYGKGFSKRC